jgi:hypothetical protein
MLEARDGTVFVIARSVRGDHRWKGVDHPWQVSRFFKGERDRVGLDDLVPTGHENARTLQEAVAMAQEHVEGPLRQVAARNPPRPAITEAQLCRELRALLDRARVTRAVTVSIGPPDASHMDRRNSRDRRAFADVDPRTGHFFFAKAILRLDAKHRLGLLSHEVGHLVAPRASERGADRAARKMLGVAITYDSRFPTAPDGRRGLQTGRRIRMKNAGSTPEQVAETRSDDLRLNNGCDDCGAPATVAFLWRAKGIIGSWVPSVRCDAHCTAKVTREVYVVSGRMPESCA